SGQLCVDAAHVAHCRPTSSSQGGPLGAAPLRVLGSPPLACVRSQTLRGRCVRRHASRCSLLLYQPLALRRAILIVFAYGALPHLPGLPWLLSLRRPSGCSIARSLAGTKI